MHRILDLKRRVYYEIQKKVKYCTTIIYLLGGNFNFPSLSIKFSLISTDTQELKVRTMWNKIVYNPVNPFGRRL